ncbi:MAG: phosphoribosyltransferase family protein [Bacteroidota bacterium]
MISDFISLVFPRTCINCNISLISKEEIICTSCKLDLPVTNDHLHPQNDLFQKFAFEPKVKSASSFIYFYQRGITQKLLHHLKYQKKKEIGFLLGTWFAHNLNHLAIDLILPVPLHSQKQRKRGYNQSEFFARGIAEILALEVLEDGVTRATSTTTQTKKSKLKRWADMENVYSKASDEVRNKRLLVVDDVITTGATIGMLCNRLVEAQAKEIHIAAIARSK